MTNIIMEDALKRINHKEEILHSQELSEYIMETIVYPREPEPLKEIRAVTASHPKANMATSPNSGQLIAMLLNLINAKKTIEIGVYTGYSLLLTALSIPDDGKIIAIDIDREMYDIGLPIIKKSNVEHKINFIESKGLLVLDSLLQIHENEGSFDFAFVDADKENYKNYHEKLMKLIRVGGVVVYDNTLWRGTVAFPAEAAPVYLRQNRKCMVDLNKALAADPRIQISLVPLGDGSMICRRLF